MTRRLRSVSPSPVRSALWADFVPVVPAAQHSLADRRRTLRTSAVMPCMGMETSSSPKLSSPVRFRLRRLRANTLQPLLHARWAQVLRNTHERTPLWRRSVRRPRQEVQDADEHGLVQLVQARLWRLVDRTNLVSVGSGDLVLAYEGQLSLCGARVTSV